MAQCPTCGAQVDENADICPECGTDLQSTAQPVQEQPAPVPEQQQAQPVPEPMATAPEVSEAPASIPVNVVVTQAPATLTLKRAGAVTSEVFNLGDRVTVGRFDADTGPVDVDLGPLPEAMYISRQHAEIYKNPEGKWMIRDMGSSNGTFIKNNETGKFDRVQEEQELVDGDEVALGNARFVFKMG